MNYSPLHEEHENLNANLTDFSGWKMPLHYGSILNEHMYVRDSVGIFDISHMGSIFISGDRCTEWLESLLSSKIDTLLPLTSQYSFLLNNRGGVIDDLIVYCLSSDSYLIIPNASRVDLVYEKLIENLSCDGVKIENKSASMVLIAVQGKLADTFMDSIFTNQNLDGLKKNQLKMMDGKQDSIIIARTGYTGSPGFELFTSIEEGIALWRLMLNNNSKIKALPCGLGCRDTLRMEAGYPLYGNELTEEINPIQAGLGYFLNENIRNKISKLITKDSQRIVYYKILEKSPPPRKGYEIFHNNIKVGSVTSGCISPTTKQGIGFAIVSTSVIKNKSKMYNILIRNRKYSLMFLKRGIL